MWPLTIDGTLESRKYCSGESAQDCSFTGPALLENKCTLGNAAWKAHGK